MTISVAGRSEAKVQWKADVPFDGPGWLAAAAEGVRDSGRACACVCNTPATLASWKVPYISQYPYSTLMLHAEEYARGKKYRAEMEHSLVDPRFFRSCCCYHRPHRLLPASQAYRPGSSAALPSSPRIGTGTGLVLPAEMDRRSRRETGRCAADERGSRYICYENGVPG